jgi:hypothetical protein
MEECLVEETLLCCYTEYLQLIQHKSKQISMTHHKRTSASFGVVWVGHPQSACFW